MNTGVSSTAKEKKQLKHQTFSVTSLVTDNKLRSLVFKEGGQTEAQRKRQIPHDKHREMPAIVQYCSQQPRALKLNTVIGQMDTIVKGLYILIREIEYS